MSDGDKMIWKGKPGVLDLLFPEARAAILRLLFSNPKVQRYVRELMVMSGLALRTIQEELATLSAAGVITSWTNGYHVSTRRIAITHFFPICTILSRKARACRVPNCPGTVGVENDRLRTKPE